MKKYAIIVGLLVAAGAAGVLGYSARAHASYSCVAGPDELCPSDFQLKQFDEAIALDAKIAKKIKAFNDEIADDRIREKGLLQDLGDGKPPLMGWDQKKKRWTKASYVAPPQITPPQVSPAPSSPAVNAPTPAK